MSSYCSSVVCVRVCKYVCMCVGGWSKIVDLLGGFPNMTKINSYLITDQGAYVLLQSYIYCILSLLYIKIILCLLHILIYI